MYGNTTPQPTTKPQYVTVLRTHLEAAYRRVRERMGHQLERQKDIYNKRVHGDPYEPGDLVWLHSPAVPWGQSKKLHRPWAGPFRVVSKLSDTVYRVQNTLAQRRRMVVHFDRFKPCPPNLRIPDAATQTRPRTMTPPPVSPPGTTLELVDWLEPEIPPTPRYPHLERRAPDRYQPDVVH